MPSVYAEASSRRAELDSFAFGLPWETLRSPPEWAAIGPCLDARVRRPRSNIVNKNEGLPPTQRLIAQRTLGSVMLIDVDQHDGEEGRLGSSRGQSRRAEVDQHRPMPSTLINLARVVGPEGGAQSPA